MLGLAGSGELLTSSLEFGFRSARSKINTSDDVTHGTTSVATKDLDGDDVGGLSDTIFGRSDGTGTVSTVTVAVLINIVLGNGSAPLRTALKFFVANVDTSVDDVDINTLTAVGVVDVLLEGSERKLRAVADTGKTLRRRLLARARGRGSASTHDRWRRPHRRNQAT